MTATPTLSGRSDLLQDAAPDVTLISQIQGSGAESGLVGQTVTVEAIVVGDFQDGDADDSRNLGGFYLQEEVTDSDGNVLTSEGIFVYGDVADLDIGDRVRVTGTVDEYFGFTQLEAGAVTLVEAGAVADVNSMAAVVDLPAAGVTQNQNGAYQPDLEAYEGMLVTIPQTLTISEQFNLDRFNEIKLVAGEREAQFTHDNLPSVEGYEQHRQELGARTITYDDGLNAQNQPIGNLDGFGPDYDTGTAPRMGDTVTGLTGVLDHQWAGSSSSGSTWRVRAVESGANSFESVNERPEEPADVGGRLQVGSFNVLNFFATLEGDTAIGMDPRGAGSAEEFARQTEKLVEVIAELDADVLGLLEIENDFLAGSDGNALEYLCDQLNAKLGEGTYAWIDPGQQFVGGDAIAVACIYKPSEVRVAYGTTIEMLDDSDLSPDLLAQSEIGAVFNGVNTSRAALTVTFEEIATGYDFTASINHFKSKSVSADAPPTGADLDALDGQSAWQNQRELAAEALTSWLATDPTGSNDSDVMLLGDFNAYFMEESTGIIENAGYENLQLRLDDPYSYVFDGQTGSLDYIFANESLAGQVTGVTEWHVNADEADALDYNLDFGRDPNIFDAGTPVRVSDHDPLLIGLDLTEEPPMAAYTLQLMHLSDGEAGLLAGDTAPNLAALVDAFDDAYANTLILSGGDNYIPGPFLNAGADSSLNAVIGATAAGRPDIAMLNAIGVEVSAIGNHEWDLGSSMFADAIRASGAWTGADFAYVSANLDFANDSAMKGLADNSLGGTAGDLAGQEASSVKGKVAPWVTVTEGGEKIGILGATTQILERISSPSGTEVNGFPKAGEAGDGTTEIDDMELLAAQLQPIIDEMIASGINKIILQSHLQQLDNEKQLATLLEGVDIILSAGSHTRLGDADDEAVAFPGHDANFADTYPLPVENAEGKTTLIVNTDSEYTYLGRLVVDFDENGDIIADSLTANQSINGAYASTDENVAEAWGTTVENLEETAFAEGTKGDQVQDVAEAVDAVIASKDGNVFGYTDVYLEGERTFVRNQETNLGNLTADANAHAAREAVGDEPFIVSLKNGGGIRSQIGTVEPATGDKVPPAANPDADKPAGAVSELDTENALRFDNKLMMFDTTPEGLLNILNWGAGLSANNGGFPQIGGVRFSFNPDLPGNDGTTPGSRIQDIALIDENGNFLALIVDDGVVVEGAPEVISVVTLSFTANGGDGYPVKQNAENFRYLLDDGTLSAPVDPTLDFTLPANTPTNTMGEQQAFEDYMREFHGTPDTAYDEADTTIALDERIQNLDYREDTVSDGAPIAGTPGDDVLVGSDEAEYIVGGAGDDALSGLGGDDRLEGGRGDDVLSGGAGDDKLFGEDGDDLLDGGVGNDLLKGGAGADRLAGGLGDDRLDGGAGADLLEGQAGDDTLLGQAGDDHLLGGQGNDTLNGNEGDDLLEGGNGNDHLLGGQGADQLIGGNGNDRLSGGDGDDLLEGGIGNDQLAGGEGSDVLVGGLGDDRLWGGEGDDVLEGGIGNDTLKGGAGDDLLTGGLGADSFVFQPGAGTDIVTDFTAGEDLIAFSGLDFASFDEVVAAMLDTAEGVVIQLDDSGDNLVLVEDMTKARFTADDFSFV
ncbi:ExeM/NucH family extracellular endonuclease [Ancylobacter oerskovii]|uniref:ExeM/NucH family extracellular endonuclease n=1 Tax=Ancylobacter oerskovii TaxID=459519 RepID=A0ABW4Z0D8_9HYPH|nr:ExeM/NucH family extracellular endonuclease [Ancylobacter oerskovii]MBS7542959.1 ExeM/NucH family extracellular endonuclease [Ancylobacter oerskovii]